MEEPYDREEKKATSDLAGQTVAYYFRLFRGPVLGVLIIEIILVILNQKLVYFWFVNLLLFIGLTLWLKKVYRGNFTQAMILGGSAGMVLGFLLALFKLIWRHKPYLFFNLIYETGITLLFGILISAATFIVLNKEYKEHGLMLFGIAKKDKKNEKGGERNGRKIKSRGKPGK